MSKKKTEKLAHEREVFLNGDETKGIKGCLSNGISKDAAETLFDQMMDFSKYAFNKAHAAAYAFVAFITAWLKYYYPAEFYAATMNWADNEKLMGIMYEAKKTGIAIKCPDVNLSEAKFTVKDGAILFGLSSVKGIKNKAQNIIEARNKDFFTDWKDFIVRSKLPVKNIESLVFAGALDTFSPYRMAMLTNMEEIKDTAKKVQELEKKLEILNFVQKNIKTFENTTELILSQENKFGVAEVKKMVSESSLASRITRIKEQYALKKEYLNSFCLLDIEENEFTRLQKEKEYLGAYVSNHPLSLYMRDAKATSITEANEATTRLFGVIENIRITKRKSDGKELAFFDLNDESGTMEMMCFTKAYERLAPKIRDGVGVVIEGKIMVEESIPDEYGNVINTYKMSVENILSAKKEMEPFYMTVSSYPKFFMDEQASFREKYEDPNGHILYIVEELDDSVKKMTFRVSEEVLRLNNVTK